MSVILDYVLMSNFCVRPFMQYRETERLRDWSVNFNALHTILFLINSSFIC